MEYFIFIGNKEGEVSDRARDLLDAVWKINLLNQEDVKFQNDCAVFHGVMPGQWRVCGGALRVFQQCNYVLVA